MKLKTNIKRWYLVKLKRFCTANGTINKMKRQPTEWDKIFANNAAIKGLSSKTSHAAQYLKTTESKIGRHKSTFLQRRHRDVQKSM